MTTPDELNYPVDPVLAESQVNRGVIRGWVETHKERVAKWTPGPMPADFDVSTAPTIASYFAPQVSFQQVFGE